MTKATYYYSLVYPHDRGLYTLVGPSSPKYQKLAAIWIRVSRIEYGDLKRRGFSVRTNKGRNLKADQRERSRWRRAEKEREPVSG